MTDKKHYVVIDTIDGQHVACCRIDRGLITLALREHECLSSGEDVETIELLGFNDLINMYVERTKTDRTVTLGFKADVGGVTETYLYTASYSVLYDLEPENALDKYSEVMDMAYSDLVRNSPHEELSSYSCPECIKGSLVCTGEVLASFPAKYKHKCNNCGIYRNLLTIAPTKNNKK